ncbi:MAG: T9SS type A sorting domain-containing protein [Bacteroidia bacterium]|nr:T9SS type A sorting domain-containing protein [Bacteroidia bacterium]
MKKLLLIILLFITVEQAQAQIDYFHSSNHTTGGCNNGSLQITMNNPFLGYAKFYLYKLPNLGPGQHIAYICCLTASQQHTFSELSPGTYVISGIQNAVPFTFYDSRSFTINASSCSFTASISSTPATAPNNYGCASGIITLDPSTNDDYTISLTNLNTGQTEFLYGSANTYTFNVKAGNYSATIVNNTQCDCSPLVLTETVLETPCNTGINAYALSPIPGCTTGSIYMQIQNSLPGSSYVVSIIGPTYQYHPNSTVLIHQFNNLPPGDYTISVYEFRAGGSGCYCFTQTMVTVGPTSPVFFNALITTQAPVVQGCNNGSVHVEINNNVQDFFFLNYWNSSWQSVYSAYLYDTNWNYISNATGINDIYLYNLAPGNYNMIISGVRFDAQSCPSVQVIQNIVINGAPCLTLSTSATGPTKKYCNDGTITACIDLVSYQCNPHIYLRDSLNNIIDQWDPIFDGPCPVTFSGLPAGVYYIEALSGSCSDIDTVWVNDGPCVFSANDFQIGHIVGLHGCNNHQLLLQKSGTSCGTYAFSCTNTDPPYNSEPFTYNNYTGQYETLADLPPGNYVVYGANGNCTDSSAFTVSDPACSISVTAIGSSDVTCSGNVAGSIINFCPPVQVELKRTSDNAFIGTVTSNDGNFVLNLLKNGNYTVTVTDNSGCTNSTFASVTNVFCPVPTALGFSQVGTQKKANIFWDEISCATGYTLQFRLIGLTTWTSFNLTGATSNSKTISGLNYGQVYEYRVRTKCTPTLNSAYSAIQTFCIGGGCAARTTATSIESNNFEMTIYPNPTTEVINIDFDVTLENPVDVYVYNQMGSILLIKNNVSIDGLQLNVSSLSNGLYFIAAMVDGKKHTARFVINK